MITFNKIIGFGILSVLLHHGSFAQSDTTKFTQKKNELGINVGPIVVSMFGSAPYSQPFGITYKRVLGKWAMRTNLSFLPTGGQGFSSETNKTKLNDSTLVWTTVNRNKQTVTGRIGAEYRHQFQNGWSLITGVDLQAQQSVYKRTITEAEFAIDSIGNAGGVETFYHTTFRSQRNTIQEKNLQKQVGLGFTLGALVPLTKNWLIAAQFRADLYAGTSHRTTTNLLTGKSVNNHFTSIDFNVGPAFSELSLYYRF